MTAKTRFRRSRWRLLWPVSTTSVSNCPLSGLYDLLHRLPNRHESRAHALSTDFAGETYSCRRRSEALDGVRVRRCRVFRGHYTLRSLLLVIFECTGALTDDFHRERMNPPPRWYPTPVTATGTALPGSRARGATRGPRTRAPPATTPCPASGWRNERGPARSAASPRRGRSRGW